MGREDFIVGLGNAQAVAFIDAWPNWPVKRAALYGPSASGKSHLVAVWARIAGAAVIPAKALSLRLLAEVADRPLAVEDVDSVLEQDEAALFALFQHGSPVLLTGREPPAAWPAELPDLASRLRAVLSFPLWAPNDQVLAALIHKLFADRQIAVSDAVVIRILTAVERSPGAIRDFVGRLDAHALAEKRPITPTLVGKLLET